MAAMRPETTCASHARSCQTGTPLGPLYLPITSVSFLVARAAVRQAAELGRPLMVAKREENEALLCPSSVLFSKAQNSNQV